MRLLQESINKPLIEKRRRARINDCLTQLKSIVLDAQESQTPRPSKLEKADILEMTVDFIKKKTASPSKNDSTCLRGDSQHREYVAGYTGCLAEVSKFLMETDEINAELRETIIKHMGEKIRDSNNNVHNVHTDGKVEQCTESKRHVVEKIPIPKDPTKSVIEKNNVLVSGNVDKTSEITDCTDIGKSEPKTQLQFDNLPTASNGMMCGSQVLLVLQLPTAQNMLVSQPFSLPFYNVPSNPPNSVSVSENVPVNSALGLSNPCPRTNTNTNTSNSHQYQSGHIMEDPCANFPLTANCDTQNRPGVTAHLHNTVQELPLNLSTNGCTHHNHHHCVDDPVSNPWRPW